MITPEQIFQVSQSIQNEQVISENTVIQLREEFPKIHFTYCMEDDVGNIEPVFKDDRFNMYLIDSRDHCLCFTPDPKLASGIVLAEIEDE